jgi:hypothetical protein
MRRKPLVLLLSASALILAAALVSSLLTPDTVAVAPQRAATRDSTARAADNPVAEELADSTAQRQEAYAAAVAAGTNVVQSDPALSTPAAGWTGEQVVDRTADDWEPAVATDPNAPYVYIAVTRISPFPTDCTGHCPTTHIVIEVSSNGGDTFGAPQALCVCRGTSWEYDPTIEVVPSTGDVYAAWLNGFNVVFSKSTDHGETWSAPVPTYGKVAWTDKPSFATSPDGQDVYLSFNGPTGGDPYVTQSHDGGDTWTQQRIVKSKRYFFAYDSVVLSDGTVIFSEGSLTYTAPGGTVEGEVWQHAIISRNGGDTWRNVIVDKVDVGEPCLTAGCGSDFYTGHSGVSADARDRIVYTYDGATRPVGPQRVFVRTSTDGGKNWSARTALSVKGEDATSPAVEAVGHGDVRLYYFQTANGDAKPNVWNVWYRSSRNGGRSWSPAVNLSDVTSGAGYKTADGFLEVYGDYGEIAVTNTGQTFAIWGEGYSWIGPGGVWYNRQT